MLDDQNRLVPEVYAILELIKSHDLVLATGHISTHESMVLVSEARNMGKFRGGVLFTLPSANSPREVACRLKPLIRF